MNKYIQKSIVPCYDTDLAWRMKPASFMNMAQEQQLEEDNRRIDRKSVV